MSQLKRKESCHHSPLLLLSKGPRSSFPFFEFIGNIPSCTTLNRTCWSYQGQKIAFTSPVKTTLARTCLPQQGQSRRAEHFHYRILYRMEALIGKNGRSTSSDTTDYNSVEDKNARRGRVALTQHGHLLRPSFHFTVVVVPSYNF